MSILHLTTDNFEQEVLNSNKSIFIDFWAEWCPPCKALSPVIDELASEHQDTDVIICKLNIDQQVEIAKKYKVMSIPTVIILKEGKEVGRSVGLVDKEKLVNLINNSK